MSPRTPAAALVLVLSAAAITGARAEERSRAETLATMRKLAAALAQAYPLSFDEERLADPSEHEAMLAWLNVLTAGADDVETHAPRGDAGFAYLGRSLVADISAARDHHARHEPREARFFLHRAVHACMACHSRRPDAEQHVLARRLTRNPAASALPAHARARLAMATRQFDDALSLHESLLADPRQAPAELDASGVITEYLTASLRVKRDAKRPLGALRTLAGRPDVPRYLRTNLSAWVRALEEVEPDVRVPPSLHRARALMKRAEEVRAYPAQRTGLVHELAASGEAHRFVGARRGGGAEVAEAFYLLGITSARIMPAFWESEADAHLEAAVRAAPGTSWAVQAMELLEERAVFAFTGSGGSRLPAESKTRIDALHGLLDRARPRSSRRELSVRRGAESFARHCASCHGESGLGDGPMAAVTRARPADLTGIRARRDGEFPATELHRVVDGRDPLPGHGSRDMPVWGLTFQERGWDVNHERRVRTQIAELIAYLESIQSASRDRKD